MSFNSYLFIFIFLPATLLGYWLVLRLKRPVFTIFYLVVASLFFYSWYNWRYLLLIMASIFFNYFLGKVLANRKSIKSKKLVLILGITVNVLLLCYFKYFNFFISNANVIFGSDFHLKTIILPLAISFFTLQQIAYLFDIYRNDVVTEKHDFLTYCLFVAFFPKLIAGPIVRFKEMIPQLIKSNTFRIVSENIAIGLTVFSLGLFKKVILADNIGKYVNPIFDIASSGLPIGFFYSWSGALAYAFQLYFDFSGYCDMAIGLGLMFGIRLPLNFYSPYRATSVRDFWSRWHMTLSRFLRDYLYIPLGGNRKGFIRQSINLMIVMLVAGFWHGAGWTFIVWGGLFGIYLVINHAWQKLRLRLNQTPKESSRLGTGVSILVTFIAVTTAWVFFRADNINTALTMLKGMTGMQGFILPPGYYESLGAVGHFLGRIGVIFAPIGGFDYSYAIVFWIFISLIICWLLPNVQEYMSGYQPSLDSFSGEIKKSRPQWSKWRPSLWSAAAISVIAVLAILGITHISEFIYFRF